MSAQPDQIAEIRARLENQIAAMSQTSALHPHDWTVLRNLLASQGDQLAAIQGERDEKAQRVETLANIVMVKNSKIDSLRGAREAQKQRAEQAESAMDNLARKLTKAEAERDALRAERVRLQQARIGDAEVIGMWMCRAEKTEAEIARLREALSGLLEAVDATASRVLSVSLLEPGRVAIARAALQPHGEATLHSGEER